MPFQLRRHEDFTTGLVATCDVCAQVVTGDNANVLWLETSKEVSGHLYPYRIACKGKCTFAVDHAYGYQYSQGLDMAIFYLINNTKTDLKRVRRNAELLQRLGL